MLPWAAPGLHEVVVAEVGAGVLPDDEEPVRARALGPDGSWGRLGPGGLLGLCEGLPS